MKNLYDVILPWAWNGNTADEEGTYRAVVEAPEGATEDDVVRLVAQEMVDSGEKVFLGLEPEEGDDPVDVDPDSAAAYINSRMQGFRELTKVADQLSANMEALFADELAGRRVDLAALGFILFTHRDELTFERNVSPHAGARI